MNKKCTSIEQSKKLLELGINPESADMHYNRENGIGYSLSVIPFKVFYKVTYNPDGIQPAWSLTALLELMPNNYIELTKDGGMYRMKAEQRYYSCLVENPVDAAFEMIVYLIEKGHIKTK